MPKKKTVGRPRNKKDEKMDKFTMGIYPSMIEEVENKCTELGWNNKHDRSKFIRNAIRYYVDTESYKINIEKDVFVFPHELYRLSELIEVGEKANIITIPRQTMLGEAAEAFAPSEPKTKLKKSEQVNIIAEQYEVSFEEKDVSAMGIQLSGVRDILTPITEYLKDAPDFTRIYSKILNILGKE